MVHAPHRAIKIQPVIQGEEPEIPVRREDPESEEEGERRLINEEWNANFGKHAASVKEIENKIRKMSLKEEVTLPE